MDEVVSTQVSGNLDGLRNIIKGLFESDSNSPTNKYPEVYSTLSGFIAYVLGCPGVVAARIWDQNKLCQELCNYLLAHVQQTEDNERLRKQEDTQTYVSKAGTFCHWAPNTSSDHTSCPYTFNFLACLLLSSLFRSEDAFPTLVQKYLAKDTCRHLSTFSRLGNDLGSIVRDIADGNVNGIHFPEFQVAKVHAEGTAGSQSAESGTLDKLAHKKTILLRLVDYERACFIEALKNLDEEIELTVTNVSLRDTERRKMEIWRWFCDVVDFWSQMYVARDISSRLFAAKL